MQASCLNLDCSVPSNLFDRFSTIPVQFLFLCILRETYFAIKNLNIMLSVLSNSMKSLNFFGFCPKMKKNYQGKSQTIIKDLCWIATKLLSIVADLLCFFFLGFSRKCKFIKTLNYMVFMCRAYFGRIRIHYLLI